jgi:DNA-binding response OmpR family regulator
MKGKRVLLVEDEQKVQEFNKNLLEEQGFLVDTAMSLAETRSLLTNKPDIIVLDRRLPDGEGLEFLKEFRKTSKIPVLILTGYGEDKDQELGFDMGCDDYLPKPYTFGVLHKRINKLLESAERLPETLERGRLALKVMQGEATVNGVNLMLTPKDYILLQFFVQNENRIMNAEYIYETIWGQPMIKDPQAFYTAISRLRKKLRNSGFTITSEYGNGYRFEKDK